MVNQRNKSDCLIAAVANAVGTSYRKVRTTFGPMERGGAEPHEIAWLVRQFGEWRLVRPRKPYSPAAWVAKHLPTGRAVVIVSLLWQAQAHAMAAVDGELIDHGRRATDAETRAWIVREVWIKQEDQQ